MKSFKYAGKFTTEEDLPTREHPEGSVKFKEPENMKKFTIIANCLAFLIMIIAYMGLRFRWHQEYWNIWGILAALIAMVPHEFLHGIVMSGDVYMYQNLKQGSLFVLCNGDMTKAQFIFCSLLPNLVFGFIPYIIAMIVPGMTFLGAFGIIGIAGGAGDYFNVFSALTQMPKGSLTYLSGMNSYWYMPKEK